MTLGKRTDDRRGGRRSRRGAGEEHQPDDGCGPPCWMKACIQSSSITVNYKSTTLPYSSNGGLNHISSDLEGTRP